MGICTAREMSPAVLFGIRAAGKYNNEHLPLQECGRGLDLETDSEEATRFQVQDIVFLRICQGREAT